MELTTTCERLPWLPKRWSAILQRMIDAATTVAMPERVEEIAARCPDAQHLGNLGTDMRARMSSGGEEA